MHNASLVVRCKKITATVLQYADGWVGGHSVFRRVTVLDKSTHVPQVRAWSFFLVFASLRTVLAVRMLLASGCRFSRI